jgi:hypothetical protein
MLIHLRLGQDNCQLHRPSPASVQPVPLDWLCPGQPHQALTEGASKLAQKSHHNRRLL